MRWWSLLFLLASGCISAVTDVMNPKITGQINVGGKPIHPTRCVAGERHDFYGADLVDEPGGATVRVVIDPIEGPRVRLMMRDRDIVLDRRSCTSLGANIQPTGWRINEYRDFTGDVTLECRAGDDAIAGKVEFNHCH